MTPDLWRRVEDVFAGTAGLATAEIPRFLDRECGPDVQLRKEVESFDTLRPGEDMVGLEKAFAAAEQEEYRPGDSKREAKESKEPKPESKKK